ncbi:MAG: hypothetical protein MPJ50_14945 [Pirellulales bacterium]|nr:hypothetical protein [Pirellulales bacterium]
MTIRFRCSAGHKLAVPDDYAGRKVRCPTCNVKLRVPALGEKSAEVLCGADEKPAPQSKGNQSAPTEGHTRRKPALPFPEAAIGSVAGIQQLSSIASLPFPEAGISGPNPSAAALGPVSFNQEAAEYQPDAGRVQSAYLLSAAMVGISLLAAAPALPYINIFQAPPWAICVLAGFVIHALYVIWTVWLPDWSTVWLGGFLFMATCVSYIGGAAIAAMPFAWFGLLESRGMAVTWSLVAAVLFGAIAVGSFRFGESWRREFESFTPQTSTG